MRSHYVYKITNRTTGEYYYGKRSCNGSWRDDSYMGSGQKLVKKMKAHPEHEWYKEVLLILDTEEEAYHYEALSIGDRWKGGTGYDGLCLNLTAGGVGGCSEEIKLRWQDADYKAKTKASLKATANTQEGKARLKKALEARWADPAQRDNISAKTAALWEDPEFRDRVSEKIRQPAKVMFEGCLVLVSDHAELVSMLQGGGEFKSANVSLHNPDNETWVYTNKVSAKRILLTYPEWRYGKRRAYAKMGVKALNLSIFNKEPKDAEPK